MAAYFMMHSYTHTYVYNIFFARAFWRYKDQLCFFEWFAIIKIDKIGKILNENIIIISHKFNRRNTSLSMIIYSKLEIDRRNSRKKRSLLRSSLFQQIAIFSKMFYVSSSKLILLTF